jgi:hypothetical protein
MTENFSVFDQLNGTQTPNLGTGFDLQIAADQAEASSAAEPDFRLDGLQPQHTPGNALQLRLFDEAISRPIGLLPCNRYRFSALPGTDSTTPESVANSGTGLTRYSAPPTRWPFTL